MLVLTILVTANGQLLILSSEVTKHFRGLWHLPELERNYKIRVLLWMFCLIWRLWQSSCTKKLISINGYKNRSLLSTVYVTGNHLPLNTPLLIRSSALVAFQSVSMDFFSSVLTGKLENYSHRAEFLQNDAITAWRPIMTDWIWLQDWALRWNCVHAFFSYKTEIMYKAEQ